MAPACGQAAGLLSEMQLSEVEPTEKQMKPNQCPSCAVKGVPCKNPIVGYVCFNLFCDVVYFNRRRTLDQLRKLKAREERWKK